MEGLEHTAKLDKEIWNKYFGHWDQLAYDAEILIAKFKEKSFEDSVEESIEINLSSLPKGEERRQEVEHKL